jgi:hypothetical protein
MKENREREPQALNKRPNKKKSVVENETKD